MDIEFAGAYDDFTALRADLVTLGYTVGELVGPYLCDCWGLTRQGTHFHAQIAVTAPKRPAPDPEPDTLLDDIAERLAQAAGVRVDVVHAGQHATGEPPPWSWLGLPSGCPPAVGDAIARLDGLVMPQPGAELRAEFTTARRRALTVAAQGPNGNYVVVETTDRRRVTLAQAEVNMLWAAGVDPTSLTRDGLLAALDAEPSPPPWFTSMTRVVPRDGHPTDPAVTVLLADRTPTTLTASQWASLHIAGVNPTSLTPAGLAEALAVSDPDPSGAR